MEMQWWEESTLFMGLALGCSVRTWYVSNIRIAERDAWSSWLSGQIAAPHLQSVVKYIKEQDTHKIKTHVVDVVENFLPGF
jgi:hypothetical protein